MDSIKKEITCSPQLQSLIRVNHAGERAAVKLYQGQLEILGQSQYAPLLSHMLTQESNHFQKFESHRIQNQIPPTLLEPLWDKAAYGLGIISALLGPKAAMACTLAIEEVIEDHYAQQLNDLPLDTPMDVKNLVTTCYQEEQEHKHIGHDHHAEEMKGYKTFKNLIKVGCRAAIWISKRV
ncbi:MAG: demethoxyubiquinone hydroxylase family protein [Alphaproteobacteria bacterium]